MSEPIPTDPVVDPDFPPEDPVPPEPEPVEPGPEMPVVGGWLDAAAQAEADAKQYTDEQVPLVAGRMVPRNMDREPTVEDGADLIAGTGWNQYDPVTNDLVQMWRWDGTAWQALDMSAEMIPVLDIGSATVGDLTGGRINVQDGPIIAGDPAGARVEITGDGLHAYDATGTETARIQGDEGVFVGGEFRTSDTLPGQVTLSDTGFEDPLESGSPGPGVGVTPRNPDGFARFPGVGPSWGGMTISGGRDATGRWGTIEASPTSSTLRAVDEGGGGAGYISTAVGESRILASGPDGESGEVRAAPTSARLRTRTAGGAVASEVNASPTAVTARTYGTSGESGWMRARPGDVELAYVDSLNTYFSRIQATETEASLFTRAGGTNRHLTVDADGIWVRSGSAAYNLEETAQDSGWHSIPLASGINGAGSPSWRNKGGMIYFRGAATAAWATGWNTVATDMPAEMRPAVRVIQNAPSQSELGLLWRMGADGLLEFYKPNSGTRTGEFSGLFYPLG